MALNIDYSKMNCVYFPSGERQIFYLDKNNIFQFYRFENGDWQFDCSRIGFDSLVDLVLAECDFVFASPKLKKEIKDYMKEKKIRGNQKYFKQLS